MTPEQAAAYITVIGILGTGVNIYLTLVIKNSILGLKLWATDKFIAKDELQNYLQVAESKARVLRGS